MAEDKKKQDKQDENIKVGEPVDPNVRIWGDKLPAGTIKITKAQIEDDEED